MESIGHSNSSKIMKIYHFQVLNIYRVGNLFFKFGFKFSYLDLKIDLCIDYGK